MPSRKWKLQCTASYCISFISLGMLMELIGPTLPGLAARLGLEGPSALSAPLFARGLGYAVGTLGMGIIIDRHKKQAHAMLVACSLIMAACAALVPHAGSRLLTACIWTVQSTAGGAVDVGGNVLIVKVWGDDKGGAPAMNALHAAWSTGSFLAPTVAAAVGVSADGIVRTYAVVAIAAMLCGLPYLSVPHRWVQRGRVGRQTTVRSSRVAIPSLSDKRNL